MNFIMAFQGDRQQPVSFFSEREGKRCKTRQKILRNPRTCDRIKKSQKSTYADRLMVPYFTERFQPERSIRKFKPMEVWNMSVISMKQLLEAGVHFGHQTRRWNPKMAPYIYTERNGIYIIDLQKSVGMIDDAYDAISDTVTAGGSVLFVGTKKQAQDAIKAEADRCGMYYVNERWLGGMLTNFKTIQSRIARLKEIERMSEDGTFEVLPKKEVIALRKEWEKLEKNLGGIKNMKRLPDIIFVVDPKKERICVQEAHKLNIPLVGIADTNCDPEELTYVIPGNDDAIRAVKLIVSKMADAVIAANQGAQMTEAPYEGEEAAPAAEEEVYNEAAEEVSEAGTEE